jgi:hypothetical protein
MKAWLQRRALEQSRPNKAAVSALNHKPIL